MRGGVYLSLDSTTSGRGWAPWSSVMYAAIGTQRGSRYLVLSSASVKRVHLVETRKNGLARRRGLYGTHIEGQEVYPSDWFRTDDLFQKDTELALNRCSGDGTIAPLVPSEALRGVRAVADTVQSAILM